MLLAVHTLLPVPELHEAFNLLQNFSAGRLSKNFVFPPAIRRVPSSHADERLWEHKNSIPHMNCRHPTSKTMIYVQTPAAISPYPSILLLSHTRTHDDDDVVSSSCNGMTWSSLSRKTPPHQPDDIVVTNAVRHLLVLCGDDQGLVL